MLGVPGNQSAAPVVAAAGILNTLLNRCNGVITGLGANRSQKQCQDQKRLTSWSWAVMVQEKRRWLVAFCRIFWMD